MIFVVNPLLEHILPKKLNQFQTDQIILLVGFDLVYFLLAEFIEQVDHPTAFIRDFSLRVGLFFMLEVVLEDGM